MFPDQLPIDDDKFIGAINFVTHPSVCTSLEMTLVTNDQLPHTHMPSFPSVIKIIVDSSPITIHHSVAYNCILNWF